MPALVVEYCLRGRWLTMIGAPDETLEEIAAGLRVMWPHEVSDVRLRMLEPADAVENDTR